MWNDFSDFYDFFYIEVVNKPKIKGEVAKHRFLHKTGGIELYSMFEI